uniref:Uncharacterized protein n=1 Tax=Triticum urartu TaxID=4572 RepID=A0A8R7QTY1_TRIUA
MAAPPSSPGEPPHFLKSTAVFGFPTKESFP